jgi:hypothetical protein
VSDRGRPELLGSAHVGRLELSQALWLRHSVRTYPWASVTAVTRIPMRLRGSGPRSGSRTLAGGLRCGERVYADIIGDDPDLRVAGRQRRCAVPTRQP